MSVFRTYNVKYADAKNLIAMDLDKSASYYTSLRLRCVAARREDVWSNALCVIEAIPKSLKLDKTEDNKLKYDTAILFEKWIDVGQLAPLVDHILQDKFTIDGDIITFGLNNVNWEREFISSGNDYLPYPGYKYEARTHNNFNNNNDALISYRWPIYPSLYESIHDWFRFRNRFNGSSDSRIGSLILLLPECRAYFEDVSSAENKVTISVKVDDDNLKDLRVKGAWVGPDSVGHIDHPVSAGVVIIKRPDFDPLNSVDLWLLGPDDSLYDFHRETQYWIMGRKRMLYAKAEKPEDLSTATQAIRMGEGPSVEFKPYVFPENPKIEELIKTVIAFANTNGGIILIGVDNHCNVIGIEKEIAGHIRKYATNLSEGYKEYIGRLKQSITDVLNSNINATFKTVTIEGHAIVLVEVPEGSNKPYYNLRTNEIYVRRGANSVRPNPDYELPSLYMTKKENYPEHS